jgi:putative ABC transport system ATP-binding protein
MDSAEVEMKHTRVSVAALPAAEHTPLAHIEDIISIHNLHKTYLLGNEGVAALRGVSLNIKHAEFIVILGKSGSGKTSLLNLLGTIDQPTKGDLYICGERVSERSTDQQLADIRLHKIGFVFQTFNLISSMTAMENVELPMVLAGKRSAADIKQRAMSLLDKVHMSNRAKHTPSQLSGGEQQRVTIARAIANNPDILLLDEPTGDLDTANSIRVLKMLLDLNMHEGITMVMVTHDVSLKNHAHRVVHMVDGKIHRTETIPEETRQASYAKLSSASRAAAQPQAPLTEYKSPTDNPSWTRSC